MGGRKRVPEAFLSTCATSCAPKRTLFCSSEKMYLLDIGLEGKCQDLLLGSRAFFFAVTPYGT